MGEALHPSALAHIPIPVTIHQGEKLNMPDVPLLLTAHRERCL